MSENHFIKKFKLYKTQELNVGKSFASYAK